MTRNRGDPEMIDDRDQKILELLMDNGRTTNAAIARQLNMAPSAVLERIRKLEKKKIITGYETRVDHKQLGRPLTTFIRIRTEEKVGSIEAGKRLSKLPEVQEVHHIAGYDCYLLKVRVRDNESLAELLKRFGEVEGVSDSHTTMVLTTIKETSVVPLGKEEE